MENAQTPDEGEKTVETPVTKPASSTRKPATARGSQAKSSTAKPSASATRKPAAKKPAARKTPARTTSAAKPGPAAAKRPAPKPSGAVSGAAKTPAGKSTTPRTAASKKPATRASGAKQEVSVTAAEDAERTLARSDVNADNAAAQPGVTEPGVTEPEVLEVGTPKPRAPKPTVPKPRAPKSSASKSSASKPTQPRATSPKPAEPRADAAPAGANAAATDPALDDVEILKVTATEVGVTEVDDASALDGEVDAAAEAEIVEGAKDAVEDANDEAEDADTAGESAEPEAKPDPVLAGLARLRALASQFAAPAAEAAALKAAGQKLAEEKAAAEKAAADKAETDRFEAERAEAERVEAERAEAEKAEAEAEVELDSVPENADADAASSDVNVVAASVDAESSDDAEADEADVAATDAATSTTAAPGVIEPETAAPDEEPSSDAPTIVAEPEREDSAEPETDNASAALVAVDATVSHGLEATSEDVVLQVNGLSKDFGDTVAVDDIRLSVRAGVFYGIVGPNGAGKTTTLSMITGLLRPDAGNATVNGVDVWESPEVAKRSIGVLPDRLRIFDRLTGSQLLYYSGVLRGLDSTEVRKRSADLATAFGLDDVMGRLVSDYSSGMLKKVALAAAMIHSPRLLVLDEPFESVDPVSAATVTRILKQYVNAGGTVLLSSHRMELVQRVCSHVAVIVEGKLLADGTIDEVRNGMSLEDRFVQLTGKNSSGGGLEWLSSFSD